MDLEETGRRYTPRRPPAPGRQPRGRRYHFDPSGTYLDYIDNVGHYYDRTGAYRGAVSDSGGFFDESSNYRGYIDAQGRYWDENGEAQGESRDAYEKPWRTRLFHRAGEPQREAVMPYRSIVSLPKSVRESLPTKAREIYMEAYNNAWDLYADPTKRKPGAAREQTAHRVAWSAVKRCYQKEGVRWVRKR